MLKKIVFLTAIALQSALLCHAQATAPAAASAPAVNNHKAYDEKARDCRRQAADQHLIGEARRSFVATCLKPPAVV
jgi:hypothetical protein